MPIAVVIEDEMGTAMEDGNASLFDEASKDKANTQRIERDSELRSADRSKRQRRWKKGNDNNGTKGKKSKISIPANWCDVPKIGRRIAESRFVAMRVPLDHKYANQMSKQPEQSWTPLEFLRSQAALGLDVRLVIDLTNTTKYYDGQHELVPYGVQYVKLSIEGFRHEPSQRDVRSFFRIVDAFMETEPEGCIAVHCTHGLNRTGYLIVQYLVQHLGMSVQRALQEFSDARPPGLIKHQYIEALHTHFAEGQEVVLPELPDWAVKKYENRRH